MEPGDGQSLVDVAGAWMAFARSDSRVVDGVEMCLYPNDAAPYGVVDPEQQAWMRPRLTPHPWKCFEQPLRLTNAAALQSIPRSHILTTSSLKLHAVDELKAKSDGRVWDIDTGHDLMITEPAKVAELLQRVASLVSGA